MKVRYIVLAAVVIVFFVPLALVNLGCLVILSGYPGPLALASYTQAQAASLAGEEDRAITNYTEAIYHHARYTDAYLKRGELYYSRGEYDKAIADLTKAIQLNPDLTEAYQMRAVVYYSKKDYNAALADYGEILRLDPSNADAYSDRGNLYGERGDYEKGIADLNRALALNPQNSGACNNLAWILATCPQANLRDGKKAVNLALKACELTEWKDFASIDTLAAAYAEVGDYDQAVKYETQCLGMSDVSASYVQEATDRLNLYKAHKPYRESPSPK
jgi:tetratricopeptide (TPR) repeat protein